MNLLAILWVSAAGAVYGSAQLIYPDQYEMMKSTTLAAYGAANGAARSVNDSRLPVQGQLAALPQQPVPVQEYITAGSASSARKSLGNGVSIIPPTMSAQSLSENWTDQVYESIFKGVVKFAVDLNNAICATTTGDVVPTTGYPSNVIFSPLSVATTLAMVLLGSSGKTFTEAAQVLGLEHTGIDISKRSELYHRVFGYLLGTLRQPDAPGSPMVNVANGIFVQEGFPIRPQYMSIVRDVYKSDAFNLDFRYKGKEAQDVVNGWVRAQTMGKIPTILSDVPRPEVNVIIASALYFKGEWKQHFIDGSTRRKPFFVEPSRSVDVDMMYNGGEFPFYEDKPSGVKILGLPYKGPDRFTMYVLLPKQHGATALRDFQAQLSSEFVERLIGNTRNETCIIGLPRMKLSSTLRLSSALKALGLKSLFDAGLADLSLLSPTGGETAPSLPSTPSSATQGTQGTQGTVRRSSGNIQPPPPSMPYAQAGPGSNGDDGGYVRVSSDADGFVFPRIRVDDDEPTQAKNNFFSYKDEKRGYNVQQWSTGFLIKSMERLARKTGERLDRSDRRRKSAPGNANANANANAISDGSRQTRAKRQIVASRVVPDLSSLQSFEYSGLDDLRNNQRVGNPGLYADEVVHKVEIEITEKGTEAAASTAILLERDGSQKRLVANRPFVFFIRHEPSKLVLFWGTINTPTPNFAVM